MSTHTNHIMSDCGHCHVSSGVTQTLDELDFERGIWFAAQYGDVNRIFLLLNRGLCVDERDNAGYTALHYAARNGRLDACKLLLSKGASIDVLTKNGRATPLHRAASTGHHEIVKLLIENKANFKLPDIDGKTALHRAAENQHLEICKTIVTLAPELKHCLDDKLKLPKDYALSVSLKDLLN